MDGASGECRLEKGRAALKLPQTGWPRAAPRAQRDLGRQGLEKGPLVTVERRHRNKKTQGWLREQWDLGCVCPEAGDEDSGLGQLDEGVGGALGASVGAWPFSAGEGRCGGLEQGGDAAGSVRGRPAPAEVSLGGASRAEVWGAGTWRGSWRGDVREAVLGGVQV